VEPTFELDLEDVLRGYDAMRGAGADLSAAWRDLAPLAEHDQDAIAAAKEGTAGPWPKRARGARRRARKLLGRLPTSVHVKYDKHRFRKESKIPWSGAHQDGSTVGRGATLPQREHVYFTEEFLAAAIARIEQHLAEAF
jgi:phage gpG-like protein